MKQKNNNFKNTKQNRGVANQGKSFNNSKKKMNKSSVETEARKVNVTDRGVNKKSTNPKHVVVQDKKIEELNEAKQNNTKTEQRVDTNNRGVTSIKKVDEPELSGNVGNSQLKSSNKDCKIKKDLEGEVLHERNKVNIDTTKKNPYQESFDKIVSQFDHQPRTLAIGIWPDYNPVLESNVTYLLPKLDSHSIIQFSKYNSSSQMLSVTIEEYYYEYFVDCPVEYEFIYMCNTMHNLTGKDMELLLMMSENKMVYCFEPNYRKSSYQGKFYEISPHEGGSDNGKLHINYLCIHEELVDWKVFARIYGNIYYEKVCWAPVERIGDVDTYVLVCNSPSNKYQEEVNFNTVVDTYNMCGYHIYQYSDKPGRVAVVENKLVTELTTLMIGKERTPSTYQYILAETRTKMKSYGCLNEYDMILVADKVFKSTLYSEQTTLVSTLKGGSHYYSKGKEDFEEYSKILKFNEPYVHWTTKNIIYLIMLTMLVCALTAFIYSTYASGTAAVAYQATISAVVGWIFLLLLFLAIIAWMVYQCRIKRERKGLEVKQVIQNYNNKQLMNDRYQTDSVIKFPLVQSKNPLADKIAEGSFIEVNEKNVKKPKVSETLAVGPGLYQIGPGVTRYSPKADDGGSQDNSTTSLVNRVIAENKFKPDKQLIEDFRKYIHLVGLKELLGELWDEKQAKWKEIVPMKFEDWVKDFEESRRKELIQAYKNRKLRGSKKLTYDVFVKVESLLKFASMDGQIEDTDPRNISGPDRTNLVYMAPWIKTFANKVKEILHVKNVILFPSGKTPLEIGGWVKHIETTLNPDMVVEVDFSRWDKTYSKELIELELEIYDLFIPKKFFRQELNSDTRKQLSQTNSNGLKEKPNKIKQDLDKQSGKVRMYTKFGDVVETTGGRKSGDPNTSIGNTLLNILMHMFAYHREGLSLGKDYALTALGDDNLTLIKKPQPVFTKGDNHMEVLIEMGNSQNIKSLEDVALGVKKTLQGLGADPKMKILDNVEQAEFCSGIFIPVKITDDERINKSLTKEDLELLKIDPILTDSYILAPKPGRFICKAGYTTQPLRKEETALSRMVGNLEGLSHLKNIPYFKPYFKHILNCVIKNYKVTGKGVKPTFEKRYINMLMQEQKGFVIDVSQIEIHCKRRYNNLSLQDLEDELTKEYLDNKLICGIMVTPAIARIISTDVVGQRDDELLY